MLLISLMLLLTSCESNPKIETIREFPDVVFPFFPDPTGAVFNETQETVTVDLDWWLRLAEYKADVDAIQAYIIRMEVASER